VTDETPAHLIRHVVIDQPRAIRGKVGDAAHSRINGGTLGCDHYIQRDSLGLTPDQRYVFFYIPVPSSEAGPPNDVWLDQAWPIGSDDIVQTALDGAIPLSQLESKVAQTPLWKVPPPRPPCHRALEAQFVAPAPHGRAQAPNLPPYVWWSRGPLRNFEASRPQATGSGYVRKGFSTRTEP
jgi:hypothetical protein